MNDAGGNSTVGHSIPVPVVRTGDFAWAQKQWPEIPVLKYGPPPLITKLPVALHVLIALFVLAALASAVVYAIEFFARVGVEPMSRAVLGLLPLASMAGVLAIGLRRFDLANGVSKTLFALFAIVLSLGSFLLGIFAFAWPGGPSEMFIAFEFQNWVVLVAQLTVLTLGAWTWRLLVEQIGRFSLHRDHYLSARETAFPGGQRQRNFAKASSNLDYESGKLERRVAVAERLTAPLLDQLLLMPGISIIEGLHFPGVSKAHVGHAIVASNRIALIDSYLWLPGEYHMDSWGRVLRDGKIDENIDVITEVAAERYAEGRPSLEIRAWAVVHCLTDGELAISCDPSNEMHLVSADDMLEQVGDWLAPVGEIVDLFPLQFAVDSRRD
jgi:hypothetical protein